MKKMAVRISDLNIRNSRQGAVSHASFFMFEGEVTALMGLRYSGKDTVASLITSKDEYEASASAVYIDGKKIRSRDELRKAAYHITDLNYRISSWTVLEYVSMEKMRWLITLGAVKRAAAELQEHFKKMGVEIDVNRRISELTETEKRMVDVVKAHILGKRILVFDDEFEGMNKAAIQNFSVMLHTLIKGRFSVLLCTNSDIAASNLADVLLFFRNGQIVRRFKNGASGDRTPIREFFSESGFRNEENETSAENTDKRMTEIYSVDNIPLSVKNNDSFSFKRGEITTILALGKEERRFIFEILSGRRCFREIKYRFDGKGVRMNGYRDFLDKRIISVDHLGDTEKDSVLNRMSVGSNLLLPSMKKFSPLEFIVNAKGLAKSLKGDEDRLLVQKFDNDAGELSQNERLLLSLDRWDIFNPNVVIFMEPFSSSDSSGVLLIKDHLKKYAAAGAAVIIIKSRHEYIMDISDKVITIEQGLTICEDSGQK